MTCQVCGATIAAKAIVCYRCGAPTNAPAVPRTPTVSSGWPALVALLVFVVLLVWLAVTLPAGSVERTLAIGGAAAAAGTLLWRAARRR